MLKLFKFFLSILLFVFISCSPSPKELKEDAAKYFNQAVDYYERGYYSNARGLFTDVLEIEEELKLSDYTGECLIYLGLIEYEFADYDAALKYNNRAAEYFKQRFNRRYEGIALNNIGNIFSQLGHFDEALDTYRKSMNISQFSADKEGEAIAQLNIGSVYGEMENYQKAFEYFQRGFEEYEILGDLQGQAVASNKIGEAYLRFGALSDALSSFDFARETAEDAGLNNLIPSIMNNIAVTYFRMGDFNSAVSALQYGEEKLIVDDDPAAAWLIKNNLGDCYQKLFRYDESLASYNEAIKLSDEFGEGLNSALIKLKKAGILLLQAGGENEQLKSAEELFDELTEFFEDVDYLPGKINADAGKSIAASFQNNNEEAYDLMMKISGLLKRSSISISNKLTEYNCLNPDIASSVNLNIPFLQLKKYHELIDFNAQLDLRKKLDFLTSLNDYRIENSSADFTDSLKELSAELNYLRFEIANEKAKTNGYKNENRLENLENRLDELNLENENPFEEYLSAKYGFVPSTVNQLKQKLNDNQLILYFFSGSGNITAAGLSKKGMFTESINVNEESLKGQVNSLIGFAEKNDTAGTTGLLTGIYNRLIKPIENKLAGYNHITAAYYFNEPVLQYLPLHALIDAEGSYLGVQKRIQYFGGLIQKKSKSNDGISAAAKNLSDNGITQLIKPSPEAKAELLNQSRKDLLIFTPVYFSFEQPTSSYIELQTDSINIPEQNLQFGEMTGLNSKRIYVSNFFTDKTSSLKLFPQFFPAAEKIIISHYNIPDSYKIPALVTAAKNEAKIYSSVNRNPVYWLSFFEYIKI